jgi:predicted enzyme related to lactoylglutathione lyase
MPHRVVWFDLPVLDLERASRFYSQVLGVSVDPIPGMSVGIFAHGPNEVTGCLSQKEGERPAEYGPLLYFNVNGRLDDAIRLTTECGGKILQPRHSIGPYGHRAVVLDSEGNRIALHSE